MLIKMRQQRRAAREPRNETSIQHFLVRRVGRRRREVSLLRHHALSRRSVAGCPDTARNDGVDVPVVRGVVVRIRVSSAGAKRKERTRWAVGLALLWVVARGTAVEKRAVPEDALVEQLDVAAGDGNAERGTRDGDRVAVDVADVDVVGAGGAALDLASLVGVDFSDGDSAGPTSRIDDGCGGAWRKDCRCGIPDRRRVGGAVGCGVGCV